MSRIGWASVAFMHDPAEMWKAPQAAELMHCSTAKVYRLAREGKLPHVRVGVSVLFPRRQLVRWLETQAEASVQAQPVEMTGS